MPNVTEELCKIGRKDWFFVSKMTRILWILIWVLEILKIFTLIGFFCTKYIIFGLENDMKSIANFLLEQLNI